MAEAIVNGGFETGDLSSWDSIRASVVLGDAFAGSYRADLNADTLAFGPTPRPAWVEQSPVGNAGKATDYAWAARYNGGTAPTAAPLRVRLYRVSDGFVLEEEIVNPPAVGEWVESGFPAVVEVEAVRLRLEALAPVSPGALSWSVDAVSGFYSDAGDLMARSKVSTFLANLKAEVEAVDPNVGVVLATERRWSSEAGLRDDGAVLTIEPGGVLDGAGLTGEKATRFWILEPRIEPAPFTNGSTEYRVDVSILGFYGHRDDEDQSATLRTAAIEILDRLTLKTTELDALGAGMGDGFLGYLEAMPRIVEPVRSAMLAGSIAGWATRLAVTYFEEVDR